MEYAYDYASNRTLRDIPSSLYATNDRDQTYGYDGLNRLKNFDQGVYTTSIASPTQEQDWTLDMLGNWSNLLEKTSGSTTLNQNRTHNNANEIATIAGASTYVGHDAAGNMTKIPKPVNWSAAYDLVFDPWNRIVQVKDGGSTVATYGYDGLHRRVTKTVGGTTEQHYYNENWQCVEVRIGTESGPARQKYIWHPYYIDALACRFADVDSNGNFSGTDEVEFPTHDANFNVTGLVNASGTVFERYYYSPYGKLSVLDANFAADADGASDVANAFTYTGRQLDSESGIYQYRYRYYHAQLGRFVGRDPIGYDDLLNLLSYAGGRPLSAVDPNGTTWWIKYGLGGAWAINECACSMKRAGWDDEYGRIEPNALQKKCLDMASKFVKADCSYAVATKLTNAQAGYTKCAVNCRSDQYLNENKVHCGTCSQILELIITMEHECVHAYQYCYLPEKWKEWEAYGISQIRLLRLKSRCRDLVALHRCTSVKECEDAIDDTIATDEEAYQENYGE